MKCVPANPAGGILPGVYEGEGIEEEQERAACLCGNPAAGAMGSQRAPEVLFTRTFKAEFSICLLSRFANTF